MKQVYLLLLMAVLCQITAAQQALGSLTANFDMALDWSMHPRFTPTQHIPDNTIFVNGYSRQGHFYQESYIQPTGYGVTIKLKVINQALIKGTLRYRWEITGIKKDDSTANPFSFALTSEKTMLYAGSATAVDLDQHTQAIPLLPFRGTYRLKVTALAALNNTRELTEVKVLEQVIEIKDFLVVVMGDSFASGEGNPDTGGDYGLVTDDRSAVWLEPLAHRSFKGALSLIAAKLEEDDPHSCITFINVASSGAKTSLGLIFQQHVDWQYKGQIAEVKQYIKDRKVDLILLSIGLNDFGDIDGMSELINAAVNPGPPEFAESHEWHYANLVLANIQERYVEVQRRIIDALHCNNVCLFQMPVQFMRNGRGQLTDGCGVLITMENEDIRLLERLGNQFIDKQKNICQQFGWYYVDGIRDMFKNHGYCAGSESWFVFVSKSLAQQGDANGSIHPNNVGHQRIAAFAFAAIKERLHRNGRVEILEPGNIILNNKK